LVIHIVRCTHEVTGSRRSRLVIEHSFFFKKTVETLNGVTKITLIKMLPKAYLNIKGTIDEKLCFAPI
jgi:hypothetical protein